MTAEQQAQIDGFRVHLDVAGDLFVVSGQMFYGLIGSEPLASPEAMLGNDDREYVTIEFIRSEAPSFAANQRVTVGSDTLQILRVENNPSDVFTKYWAVKL